MDDSDISIIKTEIPLNHIHKENIDSINGMKIEKFYNMNNSGENVEINKNQNNDWNEVEYVLANVVEKLQKDNFNDSVCVIIHSWKNNPDSNDEINKGTNAKNLKGDNKTENLMYKQQQSEELKVNRRDEEINKRNRGRPRKYKKTHLTVKDIFPSLKKIKRSAKRKKKSINKKLQKIKNEPIKLEEIYDHVKLERKGRGRPRKNPDFVPENCLQSKLIEKKKEEKNTNDFIHLERERRHPRKHLLSRERLNISSRKSETICEYKETQKNIYENESISSNSKFTKKKRGRPRKCTIEMHSDENKEQNLLLKEVFDKNEECVSKNENTKKGRGRPRKYHAFNGNNNTIIIRKQKKQLKLDDQSVTEFKNFNEKNLRFEPSASRTDQQVVIDVSDGSKNQSNPDKRSRGRPKKYVRIEDRKFHIIKERIKRKKGRPRKRPLLNDTTSTQSKLENLSPEKFDSFVNIEKQNLEMNQESQLQELNDRRGCENFLNQTKPEKRGRGRPKKLRNGSNELLMSDKLIKPIKRKRGRPKKKMTTTNLDNRIFLQNEIRMKGDDTDTENKKITTHILKPVSEDEEEIEIGTNLLTPLKSKNSSRKFSSPNNCKKLSIDLVCDVKKEQDEHENEDEDEDVDVEETSIMVSPFL